MWTCIYNITVLYKSYVIRMLRITENNHHLESRDINFENLVTTLLIIHVCKEKGKMTETS